jgi:hypothetical protein
MLGRWCLLPIRAAPVTDRRPDEHTAWHPEAVIEYQAGSGAVEQIEFPGCSSALSMALDPAGQPHLAWYTTEIRDTNGVDRTESLLVESIRTTSGWSEAVIAARTASEAIPSMSPDAQGNLILIWQEADQSRYYAVQEAYACDEEQLSDLERLGLHALLSGSTRPEGTQIPYCRNQFSGILHPIRARYSDEPATQRRIDGFTRILSLASTGAVHRHAVRTHTSRPALATCWRRAWRRCTSMSGRSQGYPRHDRASC